MKSLKKLNKKERIIKLLTRGVTEVIDAKHLEEALLSGRKLRVKHGIDPTGPKIHLGRAVALRKLREFQDLGHTIVLILGDFTAQIGDPSDKLSKRPMLTPAQVRENLKNYKQQLGKILDLKKVEIQFNSRWLNKLKFREVIELAEIFSVQQMLERSNFKQRFLNHEEISLREFMYPLMQGYDSVAVRADVEIGGFDQLFNLKAGRIIQKHFGQKEQDILMVKMLPGTDGRKMSTSWGNVINIVDEPKDMYGKLMTVRDDLIPEYFLLCTDIAEDEIETLKRQMAQGEMHPRDAKARLAFEIVKIYYGAKAAHEAEEEFQRIFREKQPPKEIAIFSVEQPTVSLIDLLVELEFASSRSAAFRLIKQGGLKIDGAVIKDPRALIQVTKTGFVLQAGKRRFVRVVLRD